MTPSASMSVSGQAGVYRSIAGVLTRPMKFEHLARDAVPASQECRNLGNIQPSTSDVVIGTREIEQSCDWGPSVTLWTECMVKV